MISAILIWTIRMIRPLLGPQGCCKFHVSCTQYATLQLQEQPLHIAFFRIIKRLLMCSPFYRPFS